MSQQQPTQEEVFLNQMRAILKPMIDSTLSEMPKDPVSKNKFNSKIFLIIGRIHDSMASKLFWNGYSWGEC